MRYAWVVLLIVCFPFPSSAEMISHIGENNPADEGWHVLSGIAGQPTAEIEPAWRIQTAGHGRWGPNSLGEENFVGEWTLYVRARYQEGLMAQQRVTIFDGYRAKSTAFTWDEAGAYYYIGGMGDTYIPGSVADGQFHDYVIVMEAETDNMIVAYDGAIVDTLTPDRQNDINLGQYLFYWGDNNGAPGLSDMEYSIVSLSNEVAVPEPSTIMLLLVGISAVGGWISWRRLRNGRG